MLHVITHVYIETLVRVWHGYAGPTWVADGEDALVIHVYSSAPVARRHLDWLLGFEDEAWWSRLAHPALHAWPHEDGPLRLIEKTVARDAPDPQCGGVLWPLGPLVGSLRVGARTGSLGHRRTRPARLRCLRLSP
jgi:hypothetical protein